MWTPPENWQDNYTTYSGTVLCSAGINVAALTGRDPKMMAQEGWVWKADGAGPTAFEAEKGQISDAFKRAWVRWGVNRAAYKLPAPYVDVERVQIRDGKPKGGRIPEYELQRLMRLYENFDFEGDAGGSGEPQGSLGAPGSGSETTGTGAARPPASSSRQSEEPPPDDQEREDNERGGPPPQGRRITRPMAGRILAISLSRADELKQEGNVDDDFHGYRIVQSLLKQHQLRTAKKGMKKEDYISLLVAEVRKPLYDAFCSQVASWAPRENPGDGDGGFSEPPKRRDTMDGEAHREAPERSSDDAEYDDGGFQDDIPF
jgi:hypothetical protein